MIKKGDCRELLRAPFPYFGGKSTIAEKVWAALGHVDHYVEPFFGSGAVLLARPNYDPVTHVESVNDKDGHICNVWRSLKHDPLTTAEYADNPVNHIDLSARRRMLNTETAALTSKLLADPEYCDPRLAGYWIFCQCTWIGSGMTRPNSRPHLGNKGRGIHAIGQIPHLSTKGQGICQVPFLADNGKGVTAASTEKIQLWFLALQDRLRRVRVSCGEWTILCGGKWQSNIGTCGYFFDPPYSSKDRDTTIYAHDSTEVAKEVAEWAVKRAKSPAYRIVIAGYDDEHTILDESGWTRERWKARGGYGNTKQTDEQSRGQANRKREVLWYSPHCLKHDQAVLDL